MKGVPFMSSQFSKRASTMAMWCIVIICLSLPLISCAGATVSGFQWRAADGSAQSFSQKVAFPEGSEGEFTSARPSNVYMLKKPLPIDKDQMLAIKLKVCVDNLVIAFKFGNGSGSNLREVKFAPSKGETTFYLSLSQGERLSTCGIAVAPAKVVSNGPESTTASEGTALVQIQWISVLPSFQGYENLGNDRFRLSDGFSYTQDSSNPHSTVWSIKQLDMNAASLPHAEQGETGTTTALVIKYAKPVNAEITVMAGTRFNARCTNPSKSFVIPLGPIGTSQGVIRLRIPNTITMEGAYVERIPTEQARLVDPGLLLISAAAPLGDYDYYRWNLLPNVLVFDFKNYALQDNYLKRIAFFVEKRGFAGKLASDEEIAPLHGWNAHDYKSDDLAAFFAAAEAQNFSLNRQELALRDFLISEKVIAKEGQGYKGLGGAIISLSRESPPYLRHTFLTHESSHAVFFVDDAYRSFCVSMWNSMSDEEKWFWYLYFGWMNYNTSSAYLMANEMQAYLVQQPYASAEKYFSTTPVSRMLEHHPELKEKLDAYMTSYGSSFTTRATAIQNWLEKEYGFAPGTTFSLH